MAGQRVRELKEQLATIVATISRIVRTVSPVTMAVAVTALSAASLFVIADIVRAVSESDGEMQIVDAMISEFSLAQFRPASLASVPIAAQPMPPALIDGEELGGLLQRGAGAFALALLMVGIAWRRKDDPDTLPDLERKLEMIQGEQRLLARRYHEEKLKAEAANYSKISFLAHLSHDIRTPLNHIIGFADLMKHQTYGPLGDERYGTYVDTIKGSGERLLGFFASILELAEFESGQKSLKQTAFAADDLVNVMVWRYRAQAMRAGLALYPGLATGATIFGDRFCLERMLSNLIENAIRFTPQGGQITVAAYAADNGIVLEVTDTGIGMSPERLAAVSQPFAFGDSALTREHDGAGLGISIARAIAEQSGGHLAIDSRPGLGTTVAISLPLPPWTQQSAAA